MTDPLVHLAPENDLRGHVMNGDPCPCLPTIRDGVAIHNSYRHGGAPLVPEAMLEIMRQHGAMVRSLKAAHAAHSRAVALGMLARLRRGWWHASVFAVLLTATLAEERGSLAAALVVFSLFGAMVASGALVWVHGRSVRQFMKEST